MKETMLPIGSGSTPMALVMMGLIVASTVIRMFWVLFISRPVEDPMSRIGVHGIVP